MFEPVAVFDRLWGVSRKTFKKRQMSGGPMITRNPLSMAAASVLPLILLLTGCASPEQRKAASAAGWKNMERDKANHAAEVTAVMRQVQTHVTAKHLDECRQALEKGMLWAANYKMTSPPAPHVGYSCHVQRREKFSFSTARQAIGYVASFTKVGPGLGPDRMPGYCGFVLDGNRLTLESQQRTSTTHSHSCARL